MMAVVKIFPDFFMGQADHKPLQKKSVPCDSLLVKVLGFYMVRVPGGKSNGPDKGENMDHSIDQAGVVQGYVRGHGNYCECTTPYPACNQIGGVKYR